MSLVGALVVAVRAEPGNGIKPGVLAGEGKIPD
jgi:hypothetical protein